MTRNNVKIWHNAKSSFPRFAVTPALIVTSLCLVLVVYADILHSHLHCAVIADLQHCRRKRCQKHQWPEGKVWTLATAVPTHRLSSTWAVPGSPRVTLYPCQPHDLALRSGVYAGEHVRSGFDQMFGMHPSFSISLRHKFHHEKSCQAPETQRLGR